MIDEFESRLLNRLRLVKQGILRGGPPFDRLASTGADLSTLVGAGCECCVFPSLFDAEWVVKIQWPIVDPYPPSQTDIINEERWSRKRLLYEALSKSSGGLEVADTLFSEELPGVAYQRRCTSTLMGWLGQAEVDSLDLSYWFTPRLRTTREVAQKSLKGTASNSPHDDNVAVMQNLDDHFGNFGILTLGEPATSLRPSELVLIDW